MGRRPRPFDARLYFEYRLFREFSNGIPDQWLTHAATAVHHIMDDYFPISVVASGGVLVYPDGRESSDTFGATLLYPKGFLFTYAAMFGNNYPGHVRYFGQNGTIERVGGDDDGTYVVKGLGGGDRPGEDQAGHPPAARSPPPTTSRTGWSACAAARRPSPTCAAATPTRVVSIMAARIGVDGQEAVLGHDARTSSTSRWPEAVLQGSPYATAPDCGARPADPLTEGHHGKGVCMFSNRFGVVGLAGGSGGRRSGCRSLGMFNRGQQAAQPALAGFEGVQIRSRCDRGHLGGRRLRRGHRWRDRALARQVVTRVDKTRIWWSPERVPTPRRPMQVARGAAEAAPAAGRRRPRDWRGGGRAESCNAPPAITAP